MRIGQRIRTGLGHGGITCVLQTQFSSLLYCCYYFYFIAVDEMREIYVNACMKF